MTSLSIRWRVPAEKMHAHLRNYSMTWELKRSPHWCRVVRSLNLLVMVSTSWTLQAFLYKQNMHTESIKGSHFLYLLVQRASSNHAHSRGFSYDLPQTVNSKSIPILQFIKIIWNSNKLIHITEISVWRNCDNCWSKWWHFCDIASDIWRDKRTER